MDVSWTIKKLSAKELMLFNSGAVKNSQKSPLDSKEIEPVSLKGNQPEIFIGWTDSETEAPKLWLPDASSQLIVKDPDAGKD